jgi:ABC-2 type transport system permease protein
MMRARAVADMQYRLSFWLRIVAAAIALLGDVFAVWALEHRFGSIGGWTFGPLLFLLGVVLVAFRLADAFIGGAVERCAELVRTGRLDSFMVRPVGVLWQILGESFAVRRAIQLLTVTPVLAIGLSTAQIDWSPSRVVAFVLMMVNATAVFASIFVIANTLSFWSPGTTEIANAFTYGGSTAAQYPAHAMDRWVRVGTLSVLPVALTAYVPSYLFLAAPNPLGVTELQSWLAMFTGVPAVLLARFSWVYGLNHYRSTGS